MASVQKTMRYWVRCSTGNKLWFQNGVDFLNHVKSMPEFSGGNQLMTIDEWRKLDAPKQATAKSLK